MAILLVKIEDEKSLAFNEFFDYNGFCYACTGSRNHPEGRAIDMSDFYEAAVNTEVLSDVPVVFVTADKEAATVLGWYRKAEVFRESRSLSFFLEGNVKAYAADGVWLPKESQTYNIPWPANDKRYEVIEEEDTRFRQLEHMLNAYGGANQLRRYYTSEPHIIPKAMQDPAGCRKACERWAALVASEECQDIRDLKTLEVYAKKLCEKAPKDPDGYYYLALADYHLGFVKEGLKQIGKALKLEPEAADLIALKGLLLVSRGYMADGAEHLHRAWEISHYDTYLILEGRAFLMVGQADKAYDCFKQIGDESVLEEAGIRLRDMEKKWSSFKFGYIKLREMLRRK